ncbi:ribokinase [Altererythrobacter indicus]|uniref:Ribokinase n=1 Tax=Altericroceibacterium indicum TaxID=374177 RepID=A0A845A5H7_9SPHN|nr:ribokinase [Altericroceibacterium indicum]MXP24974.1 ribokinase [Altericroceibacterium indicum]
MAVEILGSINVDIIAALANLPRPGETVLARSTEKLPGGKGANQAVAASRFGADTYMIGAVGKDGDGVWMRSILETDGVHLLPVDVASGTPTGMAYIALDAAGENQIIVAPGANMAITADAIGGAAPDARVFLAQLEVPIEAIAAFFNPDRVGHGLRLLNCAPAIPEARALFADTDILILNQTELAEYAELDTVNGVDDALAARQLITRDDQSIVVTLGAGGSCVVRRNSHCHAPAVKVVPVDTIGAGDCFVGALAALLDEGARLEDALPIANAAAAQATQVAGGVPSMPMRAMIDEMLAEKLREPT